MTPTQRTRALLKKRGIESAIVERWNSHCRVRQDLFGFIDLLALDVGKIIGIQVTSGGNLPARKSKIEAEPRAVKWLEANGAIVVHGWVKRTKNKRTIGYALRVATAHLIGDRIEWTETTIEPQRKAKSCS